MIPGFLITLITFPGVIVHELAHAIFCRLFGLKIYEVCFFQVSFGRGQPAGYVVHEPAPHWWQNLLVSIGPFFVNTIIGSVIAAPAVIPVLQFHSGDLLDYALIWLGVSITMHSFPSTGDAASIYSMLKRPGVPTVAKIVGFPVIGFIYLGALGSFFWLDLLYGIAVAGFLPKLIIAILA
jgi:hypothetical protein